MRLNPFLTIFDSEFVTYLHLGWDHIIDLKAYDHLLFVMTLCAIFTIKEWRKVLVIITAFTIGHSLTLALSTFDYIIMPNGWAEIIIPLTILFTAMTNLISHKTSNSSKTFDKQLIINYAIALFFGLIHGLGFASNFKFMLGDDSSIIKQLFAFNTGLELGQIVIVLSFFITLFIVSKTFKIVHREWTIFFSGAGAGLSVMMITNALIQ